AQAVHPWGQPISQSTNSGFRRGFPFSDSEPAACCASPGLLVLPPSANGRQLFSLVTPLCARGVAHVSPNGRSEPGPSLENRGPSGSVSGTGREWRKSPVWTACARLAPPVRLGRSAPFQSRAAGVGLANPRTAASVSV